MESIIESVQSKYRKKQVVDVRSGDTVRVSQRIKEGNKERVQVFEGLVIRTRRTNSLTSTITVRRIASGVGVEKTFMIHSPLIEKIEVVKRSKVRRNYLSYMRERGGKSARLASKDFDKGAVNSANNIVEVEETAVPADAVVEAPAEEATPAKEATDEPKEEKQPEVKSDAEEKPAEETKS